MISRVLGAGFALSVSLALSCTSIKPLYAGDRRPADEVGMLKMVTNGAITSIGGRSLEGRAYELLPGDYSIEFRAILRGTELHPSLEGQRNTIQCQSRITVEATHEYQITRTRPKSPMMANNERQSPGSTKIFYQFKVYVVDLDPTGKPIGSIEALCSW